MAPPPGETPAALESKNITTHEQKLRLSAIRHYQVSGSVRKTAEAFGRHFSTIAEWVRMYNQGGEAALAVPLKPRPVYNLDAAELRALKGVPEKYARRIAALLRLAETGNLSQTAADFNISPQCLMGWRRGYKAGEWP